MDLSLHKKKNFEKNEKENDEVLDHIYDKLDEKFGDINNENHKETEDMRNKASQIEQFLVKSESTQNNSKNVEPAKSSLDFSKKTEQYDYKQSAFQKPIQSYPSESKENNNIIPFETLEHHLDNTDNRHKTKEKGFSKSRVKIGDNKQSLQKKQKSSFFKMKKDRADKKVENTINKSDDKKHIYDGSLIDDDNRPLLDDDVRKLLLITDKLLGKLPENVIEEFASSDDFTFYERIMNKYHIK